MKERVRFLFWIGFFFLNSPITQADTLPSSVLCAQQALKTDIELSKIEIATLCQGTIHADDALKCVKAAVKDEDLSLTKMWTAQLCGRNGSPERIRCFKEALGSSIGMNRQEALELCRP